MFLILRILSTPWWAPFAAVYGLRRFKGRARRAEQPLEANGAPGPPPHRDHFSAETPAAAEEHRAGSRATRTP